MDKKDEMVLAITDSILSLFRDEENNGHPVFHYDLDEIDATEFFISMVKGCAMVFNKLTNANNSCFEFTHICNQLIVQDMLESKDYKIVD